MGRDQQLRHAIFQLQKKSKKTLKSHTVRSQRREKRIIPISYSALVKHPQAELDEMVALMSVGHCSSGMIEEFGGGDLEEKLEAALQTYLICDKQ